jgi:hypothetical protein
LLRCRRLLRVLGGFHVLGHGGRQLGVGDGVLGLGAWRREAGGEAWCWRARRARRRKRAEACASATASTAKVRSACEKGCGVRSSRRGGVVEGIRS